jgi:flavin reductase (DIM6/NTAB) family NADH-FMN oxidoreductase RutF
MILDASKLTGYDAYNAITQTIVPRPVAWVLSDNGDASFNLAPFSYFSALTSDPMLLTLSIGNKRGGEAKDTLHNIGERNNFVIHIPHREQALSVTKSAAPLEHGDSELSQLGLETAGFDGFALPRIKDCRIALGCTHYQTLEIGPRPQSLLVGEIQSIYVDDSLLLNKEGEPLAVDTLKLDPLGRLGGNDYITMGEVLTVLAE